MAISLPPSQLHTSPPLSHLHGPCRSTPHSCTHYIAAPITAAYATSPCTLQLHGHIVASLTAMHMSPPLSHLCGPHCSTLHHIHFVAAPIAAAHTTLPHTLQLHRLCQHLPLNHTPCIVAHLAALHTTLLPPSSVGTWAHWLWSVAHV